MTELVATFLGAALWSGLFTGLAWAAARAAGLRLDSRDLPVLASVALFLTLTAYPLPDPALMRCPDPRVVPDFLPGNSVTHVISQVRHWGWEVALFDDRTVITGLMNFLLCLAIGLALARQGRFTARAVLLFGLAMPVAVELTQLTGSWGLFPCAYRKFDMDDIVLNFAGIACGFWLAGRRAAQAPAA